MCKGICFDTMGKGRDGNDLLFGLGRPNVFPKGDVGLQRTIERTFQLDYRPTMKEMDAFQRMWEPYASYAALYLWRSIE